MFEGKRGKGGLSRNIAFTSVFCASVPLRQGLGFEHFLVQHEIKQISFKIFRKVFKLFGNCPKHNTTTFLTNIL